MNPGDDDLYEFVDQSDAIPQRIYLNYKVTDLGAGVFMAVRSAP